MVFRHVVWSLIGFIRFINLDSSECNVISGIAWFIDIDSGSDIYSRVVLDIKIQRDGDNFKNIRRLLITLKKNFFPLHPPWHCINLLLLNGWSNRLIFWYPFCGLICKYFESFYLIQKWDAFVLVWYFLLEMETEYDFYLHFYNIICIFWYCV